MKINTPSHLKVPSLLMNFPFTLSNDYHNNPWMKEYNAEKIDYYLAFSQFTNVYQRMSQESLIYLLPSEGEFQDQIYVANLGCYLPHITEDTIIVANYKSPPRVGEEVVGEKFFKMMKYKVDKPPTCWEGEADLKYIRDNIYVCGYGIRTDVETHDWFRRSYDMNILPLFMNDEWLYHLDCLLMPITKDKVLAVTHLIKPEELRNLEKYVEVISIPEQYAYDGWTNSVIVGNKVFYGVLDDASAEGHAEFERLMAQHNLYAVPLDISEFDKSGACLSCMVMHFNYL